MEEDDDKLPTTTATTTMAFVTVIFLLFLSTLSLTTADDTAIMMKLSASLTPSPPTWSGNNPCKWQGVSCDSSGRVTAITLTSRSLTGTIPSEITQLSSLQSLSLQNNQLTGTIPPLANMTQLQEVYIDGNSFTKLPSTFLVGLPNLQTFSMNDIPLPTWTLPVGLSDSSSLQEFRASNTNLVGSIPDIFASFPGLKDLRLSYNNLTGFLPASLAGSGIQNVWINNQKQGLSGVLDVFGKMPSLSQLWVQQNSFIGPIPDLSKCTSLFDLQLRDNHLTGVVPPSLSNLPNLVNISMQNNQLQGPMPVFKGGVQVTLGFTNSFCKDTPGPCDPQVTSLLDIVGSLGYPSELVVSWKGNDACKNWAHVSCDSNGNVVMVNFAKQNWSGTISPSFANLTSLTSILLNDNNLVGSIPGVLASLKMLQKFDVSNNNLTGKIPTFARTVEVISTGNPFLGTNVDTTKSLKSPPDMNNSPTETNDSDNPTTSLSKLHFSRSVVIGVVIVVIVLLVAAGYFLYPGLKKLFASRNIKGKKKKKNKFEDLKMSPIGKYPQGSPKEQSNMRNNGHNNPLYDQGNSFPIEVLREVTDNFSERNVLGRGGFGIVYKGVLQDGTEIAVKRMESNLQGSKGKSEFEAEITVLTKVRHRHLVALLGYCINENERIVVYEYMPQGTLGQHLFEYDQEGRSPLTWKQRLVIALDVARGVEYLHSLAQQSFIHRDLKPSNVLLGDNMRAKVSDFGLVKNASDQGKYSLETRLAGTFGYLAPEYAATGRVTTKVDVFAFGVVLMEIITGRKALDEKLPEDQAQLASWFRRVLITKESIRKAIDPNLETDIEETFESICKVAELSGHCTAREPQQRPDMSHAVNILSPLVEQWRPAELDTDNDCVGINTDVSLPQALQRWQAGETTMMSEYSSVMDDDNSRHYHSSAPTTPAMGESFTNFNGR
ncbi:receptor-like kinase TMK4 [Spinacia oleracea]|uniref:Receptor-like kinase TMK4 n=1 Tax=Spinacia oleracea TaxID=3562 RepID=A0ABM3R4H0_SPIOL|nr:receptor-like kinase TMK4 [Spinacia oleracea]